MTHKIKEKFEAKWGGPFVIKTVYSNGVYCLINQDGNRIMMPISGKFLKKYYIGLKKKANAFYGNGKRKPKQSSCQPHHTGNKSMNINNQN